MKKDDRIQDKAMEKLVANKLRGQLQPQAAGCPDTETLAAYVDGTLAGRERRQWEGHFATCSRCQEQVATLVRWSEEDEPLERKVVLARPRAFAGFRWVWAAPVLVAVFVAGLWYTGEFRSRLRQTQETSLETQSSAPAPATPAGPQGPSVQGPTFKGEVAETRKAGTQSDNKRLEPLPLAPRNEVDSLKDQEVRRDLGLEGRNAHATAELAAPAPASIPAVTTKAESTPIKPGALVAPTPMAKPSERLRMAATGTLAERGAAEDIRTTGATGGGRGGGGAASSLGGAAVVRQEAEQASAAQPPAPGAAGGMKEKKAELNKQRIATNLAQEASLMSRADGWRVGLHGLIQKTDARGDWITVPSGIDADLFDISFPAPNVGWAVGQTGCALRTTDGGKTWSRIPTPTREDLIKVYARTELAVRIETRNHQAWETTDGGESWSRPRPE